MTDTTLALGSLFAGVGGFDLAAERIGMEAVYTSEVEEHPQAVLTQHFPDAQHLGDVTEVTSPPAVDVITAGSPCQGFSVAGLGKGMDDDRSSLFGEFVRIVRQSDATWAVWENVPGALTSNKGADIANVLGALLEVDQPLPLPRRGGIKSGRRSRYHGVAVAGDVNLAWRVLDARYHGVAQRRKRILAVVHRGEWDYTPPAWRVLFPELNEGELAWMLAAEEAAPARDGSYVETHGAQVWLLDDPKAELGQHGGMEGWAPNEVSLTSILEWHVPEDSRYWLSEKACTGILRRARRRGKSIDPILEYALTRQAGQEVTEELAEAAVEELTERGALHVDHTGTLSARVGTGYTHQDVQSGEVQVLPTGNLDPAGTLTKRHHQGVNTTMDDGAVISAPFTAGTVTTRERMAINGGQTAYPVVGHWRKSKRARSPEDYETWVPDEDTNTLNTFDTGDTRTVEVVVTTNELDALDLRPRRLLPLECERLQGFPDGWTASLPDSARFRAMGNAVAVPVAEAVLHRLAEVHTLA